MAFDKKQYDLEYRNQHYCKTGIRLPHGCKADVAQMAADYGLSMTEFALRAVEQKYNVKLRGKTSE